MQPPAPSRLNNISTNNTQFFNPTPVHLRTLVLDYLCHGCFPRTAQAFLKDSAVRHLDPDGDEIASPTKSLADSLPEGTLQLVSRREQIRNLFLAGKVDNATAQLNEDFPFILSKHERTSEKTKIPSDSSRMSYVAPASVDLAHLVLNLRIHAFIEACRSVPLLPPDGAVSESLRPPEDGLPFAEEISEGGRSAPEIVTPDKQELLAKAQKLYELAKVLEKPDDRATYLKELANVAGLLAYATPEKSPMAKYLSQERREAVAGQIDSAILYTSGLPVLSHLELYTRYTTTIWSFIRDLDIKPPTNPPLGVQFPMSISSDTSQAVHNKAANGEKENIEIVPTFDLRRFLDSKS